MCVCESISPGSTVAFERSITLASAGIVAELSVTFSMRPPRTKISWFFLGLSLVPSIKVPARITATVAEDCAAVWLLATPAHSKASAKKQINERRMENLLKDAGSLPQTGAALQQFCVAPPDLAQCGFCRGILHLSYLFQASEFFSHRATLFVRNSSYHQCFRALG